MAEIHEPTPIKPNWPTRRDGQPRKRKPSENAGNKQRKSTDSESGKSDSGRPSIDDYA